MYGMDYAVMAEAEYRAERLRKSWPTKRKHRRGLGTRKAPNELGGPNEGLR